MPALERAAAAGVSLGAREWDRVSQALALVKRITIPVNSTSPPGLIAASKQDPWAGAGKYGLGWVYFCILLLVITTALRFFNVWKDKIRTALYKDEIAASTSTSPDSDYEMKSLGTANTATRFFPPQGPPPAQPKMESSLSTVRPLNKAMALYRSLFYRPIPSLRWRKHAIVFPSVGTSVLVGLAVIFVTLYCFIPQPLYYESIRFGSPPLGVRAGMLAVAMVPWIVAMSMKANLVSLITGIGHERLNVLHRWGGYICLFLSLVHALPFYIQPMWEKGSLEVFKSYFKGGSVVYGSGVACLVPLIWLCVASLPAIRRMMYELFVVLHVPAAVLFVGMLFWHCNNYLTSWDYLWATVAIWLSSYLFRLFKLNWTNPWRLSWLIGDEAAVALLPENAVKLTIPTQVRWKPGQYIYLRIPGISVFENHPFTIASLCSDDFPSEYGEQYRDMALVFKPFGGFTRKVVETALRKGPLHTYRVFLDGPYGGMQRSLDAFDNVVLVAGGSGITALVSHLLDLVKRMRDGKAVTRKIQIIWAVKRLESMEWFKEELRICREYAPPDSVECQFFVTAAKRQTLEAAPKPVVGRPISGVFGSEKINELAQSVATKRNSALIRDEAGGDAEKEQELRRENEDGIASLPPTPKFPRTPKAAHMRQKLSLDLGPATQAAAQANFDFGFPSTPTIFQKNLMRFAFGVSGLKQRPGWSIEYGRPDIPFMLRDYAKDFGKRSCVFVCGPPNMRIDVANTVARLQRLVVEDPVKEEIYLHYEDFAF